MSNYTFSQIKDKILQWSLNDISKVLFEADIIEITKNDDEILLVDLTFEHCLARITVNNPTFAPYQFVFFEAISLDSKKTLKTGSPELIYFFYDSDETIAKKLMKVLDYGVEFCSNYIPEQLSLAYINKTGTVSIDTEELLYVVHPDDIKKVNADLINGEFTCVDIEAQYLVLRNNSFSFRLLPELFTIK